MSKPVSKANSIIESSYKLTLNEQRLITLCIQKISKGQDVSPSDMFVVSAREFSEKFQISSSASYKILKQAELKLYNRSIELKSEGKTRWIYKVKYLPNEGKIILFFTPDVIPFISKLDGSFTQYQVDDISGMTSIYGIRFYELFKCWLMGDKSKTKTIAIDELKTLLDLKDSKGDFQYASIRDFKLKVLEKGFDDVSKNTDITATYNVKKEGRKITHLDIFLSVKSEVKNKFKDYKTVPDEELETVDKPITKNLAKQEEARLITLLQSPDKLPQNAIIISQEQASNEFRILESIARSINSNDISGFIMKSARPEFREAFKQYGLI